jgi:hypothetical protein
MSERVLLKRVQNQNPDIILMKSEATATVYAVIFNNGLRNV